MLIVSVLREVEAAYYHQLYSLKHGSKTNSNLTTNYRLSSANVYKYIGS